MMEAVRPKRRSWLVTQLLEGLSAEQFSRALADIRRGWQARELWWTMGLHDIRQRYRRSFLGPFWITISMGVMVAALGLLYGQIFGIALHDYLPFLSCGFVIWGLISGLILDGTRAFISSDNLMRQLSAPVSIYVYRSVWSNLIIFAHNIWIFLFVALWFQVPLGWSTLWSIPALFLLLANGLWVGLLFGLLSARFRDIPLIIASIVQVMFFITPVIWRPSMLSGRALFLDLNPFYHLVEILRAPLLGLAPNPENWIAVLVITVLGWGLTIFFYTAYRWRVAYWV
jgi:ABC-2 type transport system permease protein/lipopolysaccharide transport system permease protein